MRHLAAACAVALSLASLASAQVSPAGAWALEMLWPGGKSSGSCTFTIDGDRLTGTCGAEDRFPVTGHVEGWKLSWWMDVKQGDAAGRLEFDGELDEAGTTIRGTCNVGDQFGSFTMTRKR